MNTVCKVHRKCCGVACTDLLQFAEGSLLSLERNTGVKGQLGGICKIILKPDRKAPLEHHA